MLKEKALASALVKAAYLDPKESRDAASALNWRGDSTSKTAGNFAKTMYEVRLQAFCASPYGAHLLRCSCPLALCTALQTTSWRAVAPTLRQLTPGLRVTWRVCFSCSCLLQALTRCCAMPAFVCASQTILRGRCGQMDKPKGTKDTEGRFKGRFTLTVGDLNAKLDELVAAGGGRGIAVRQQGADSAAAAGKRAAVLRGLMQATTPTQMRWIVQIIIGNLKASPRDSPRCAQYHNTHVNAQGMSAMSGWPASEYSVKGGGRVTSP